MKKLQKGGTSPKPPVAPAEQEPAPSEQPAQPAQPEQPRNWLDILLKIGLGVCILVLLVMVYKLIFSDSSSLLGESEEEKPQMNNDDFTIFPGLFDEPLTLFERGDSTKNNSNRQELETINASITEINNKLTNIKATLPCDKNNQELYSLAQKYSEQYNTKKLRDGLTTDEVLKIDRDIQNTWTNCSKSGCTVDDSKKFYINNANLSQKCNVFKEKDTNLCKKSYLFNYLDNGVIQCPTLNDDKCVIKEKSWELPSMSSNESKYNVCISENEQISTLEGQLKTYTSRKDELLKSTDNSNTSYKILFG